MRRFFWILLSFSLLSCAQKEPIYYSKSYVFGTLVDITIYGEPEDEAQLIASNIMRQFQEVHDRLHAWKPSELHSINRAFAKGTTPVRTKDDVAQMITLAQTLSVQSNGLFNPAIGQLIHAWGFQSDEIKASPVEAEHIATLVASQPQMSDIVIEGGEIFSNNPNVMLDLGGYAKGYALDLGMQILKESGVKNALINIGGNVIALGKHGEKPWRVGIQHPRKPNAIAALDLPSGWAIGTSGDYQRYFMQAGKRYCHIIDPRTGYPAQGTQSVTVLIPPQSNVGVLSDVASKPIFISEPSQKSASALAMGVQNVMVIQEDGSILVSPSMLKRLEWLEPDAKKHIQTLE